MEIADIDNSFHLSQSILWQYDHAPNLIGMFSGIGGLLKKDVSDFWDWFAEHVADIDKADYFGLNVWGVTLGVPRPFIPHGQGEEPGHGAYGEGELRPLSNEVFRRVLKARMYMLDADASCAEFAEGLKIAFEGRVGCVDGGCDTNQPMAMFLTNNMSVATPPVTYYCYQTSEGDLLYCTKASPTETDIMYMDRDGVFTDSGTTYDPLAMERKSDGDVQAVSANSSQYIEEPTDSEFPDEEELALRLEEYDLLSNPEIIESVFPFPSGVKTDGGDVDTSRVIGLNVSQEEGQNKNNFSPVHAEATDDSVNGGQFAISEGVANG